MLMSPERSPPPYRVAEAQAQDDALIRQWLRHRPMQGAVRLSFEREPSAFLAATVEGGRYHCILVRDRAGQLLAMGSRCIRPVYVDGAVRDMGYLGQLRSRPHRNSVGHLAAGFRGLAATRSRDQVPFDLTSIVADNAEALRLLEQGIDGLPRYHCESPFTTFLLPTSRRSRAPGGHITPAARADIDSIAGCLQGYLCHYQFAPHWSAAELLRLLDGGTLACEDFLVIRRRGGIAACAALWDQRAVKQVVVQGYSPALTRWRPLLNIALHATRRPRLPRAPAELKLAYLSHLAVPGNDPRRFAALVRAARHRGAQRGLDYLAMGLAPAHPLYPVLRGFPHFAFESRLYTVHWDRGEPRRAACERIPFVEVALL